MQKHCNEEWRDVVGFEGYYQVSNLGRVRSLEREIVEKNGVKMIYAGQLLSISRGDYEGYKYCIVGLCRNGKQKMAHVHSLVLTAFVGPRPVGMEACHFPDHSPGNNRLDNLRWDTHVNNYVDQHKQGRTPRGERKPHAKLTFEIAEEIRQERKAGYKIKTIAERRGVSENCIQQVLKGITWFKREGEDVA